MIRFDFQKFALYFNLLFCFVILLFYVFLFHSFSLFLLSLIIPFCVHAHSPFLILIRERKNYSMATMNVLSIHHDFFFIQFCTLLFLFFALLVCCFYDSIQLIFFFVFDVLYEIYFKICLEIDILFCFLGFHALNKYDNVIFLLGFSDTCISHMTIAFFLLD